MNKSGRAAVLSAAAKSTVQDDGAKRNRRRQGDFAACPWSNLGADGAGLEVENFLTFMLARLGNAGQRVITARYLEPFEIKVTEWRMLAALAAFSPMPFGELVRVSSSDKALVSRTLRNLVTRELAVSRQDDNNARKVVCTITERGRELYHRIMPVAQQRQAELLGVLSADERVALFSILHKLDAVLEPDRPRGGAQLPGE